MVEANNAPLSEDSGEEMTYGEFMLDCARAGDLDGVKEALAEEVPVDFTDPELGNSALHNASANGQTAIIELLLQAGADINLANKSKNSALHWACLTGQFEAVKLLCQSREGQTQADTNLKNNFGRVPMEEALQSGRADIAEFLAPLTKLEDDKLYSTIQEGQIEDMQEQPEEEKQKEKDWKSLQREPEEAITSEENKEGGDTREKRETSAERQTKMEQQLSEQIKEKLNMKEFEVEVKAVPVAKSQ